MPKALDDVPPGLRDFHLRTIFNPVMGERVTFTSYSAETHGQFTATTITVLRPGDGPPAHYHTRMRETFTAGSKGCGVQVDGVTHILKPGQAITVQRNQVHRFFNHLSLGQVTGESAEITVNAKSEGLDGKGTEDLEKGLSITYGLARDGKVWSSGTPKNPIHIAIASGMGDLNLPGVLFRVASPVLKVLRWYAQWSGEEQRLLDKYWFGYGK